MPRYATLFCGLPFLCLALCGCVERWINIQSEPSGAHVFLDSKEVGVTPLKIPFDHYGHREVMLRFEDPDEDDDVEQMYASVAQMVHLETPWYQYFPLDLLVEHMWPWTIIGPLSTKGLKANLPARGPMTLRAGLISPVARRALRATRYRQ